MTEIRIERIEHYDNEGNLISSEEIPYEVSDEQLAIEAVEKETAEANDQALVAYQNFDSLTLNQKDKVLKGLLGDFISRHRDNYM